jgi:hypothetical protein
MTRVSVSVAERHDHWTLGTIAMMVRTTKRTKKTSFCLNVVVMVVVQIDTALESLRFVFLCLWGESK